MAQTSRCARLPDRNRKEERNVESCHIWRALHVALKWEASPSSRNTDYTIRLFYLLAQHWLFLICNSESDKFSAYSALSKRITWLVFQCQACSFSSFLSLTHLEFFWHGWLIRHVIL
jgi:hypothetical protein